MPKTSHLTRTELRTRTVPRAPSRHAAVLTCSALALATISQLLCAASLEAQVLLLPVERGERIAEASSVADAAATTGTTLRSHEAAREALLATHGEDPPEVSESDLARWVASSRQAVRSLARADYEGARSALAQAESVTDRALAELNREAARSRQVLDTCLYLVRSLEETDQHSRAVEQGHACRRLVPRGEPTLTQHPPEVRTILEEVDRALAQMPGARLRVLSEPSGCAVRLNGLDFGVTPLLTEDLRPGEYRVQIECGQRRGRIHRVDLTRAGAELRVDAVTESVLGTSPLRVVLGVGAPVDEAVVAQVSRLGRIAGAREVWLVDETGSGRRSVLTLHRIEVGADREIATVRTGARSLPLALASLRQGRSHDWTTDQDIEPGQGADASTETLAARERAREAEQQLGVRALPEEPPSVVTPARPVVVEPPEAPVAIASGPDHTAENWIGAIAIGLGAGAYGIAWGLWDHRSNTLGPHLAIAEPTDLDYLTRQRAWLDGQLPALAVGGVGAVLWAVSVPLVFGPDSEIPWWSWVLGGVGVVGVGVGIGVMASTAVCTTAVEIDQPCVDASAQWDAGFLVLTHGAPLLAFPITHLLRAALGTPAVRASAEVRRDGAVLGIGGVW